MSEFDYQQELELDSLKLREQLVALYENQQYCDVKLHAHGHQFSGHKCILASRSVFLKFLLCEVRHEVGSESNVHLAGVPSDDIHTVGSVIRYLYTGHVQVTQKNFISLYRLSVYFGVPDLLELLDRFTEMQVTTGSFLQWYLLLLAGLARRDGEQGSNTCDLSTHCLGLARKQYFILAASHNTLMEISSTDLVHCLLPEVCSDGPSLAAVVSFIKGWLVMAYHKQDDARGMLMVCERMSRLIQSADRPLPTSMLDDIIAARDFLTSAQSVSVSDNSADPVLKVWESLHDLTLQMNQSELPLDGKRDETSGLQLEEGPASSETHMLPVARKRHAAVEGAPDYHEDSDTDVEETPPTSTRYRERDGVEGKLMSDHLRASLSLISQHAEVTPALERPLTSPANKPASCIEAGRKGAPGKVSRKMKVPRRVTRLKVRLAASGGDTEVIKDEVQDTGVVTVKTEVNEQQADANGHVDHEPIDDDADDGDDDDDFSFEGYSYAAGSPANGNIKNEYDSNDVTIDDKSENFDDSAARDAQPSTSKGKRYTCKLCGKGFTRRARLREHMESEYGLKSFNCPLCGLVVSRNDHLVRHIRRKHGNVTTFSCDECGQEMSGVQTFIRHRLTHSKLPASWPSATLTTEERSIVSEHQLETGMTEFTCIICEETFYSVEEVKQHAFSHLHKKLSIFYNLPNNETEQENRNQGEKNVDSSSIFNCDTCKKSYRGEEHYRRHLTNCRKRYQCGKCDKWFRGPSRLRQHEQQAHKTDVHVCTECSETFNNRRGLTTHVRFMHQKEGKSSSRPVAASKPPIICEVCGLSFRDNSALRRHMSDHTGQKEHPCGQCEKQYRDKASLNTHILKVHLCLKPFMCEICAMEFSVKSNMLRHLRRHRGELRFFCDTCGKGFVANCDLNRHKLTHSTDASIKKHACKFCGKTFTRANKVVIHERIHTGEKPYVCGACGKRFTQNGDRLRHEARMHNIVHTKHQTLFEMANDTPEPVASAALSKDTPVSDSSGTLESIQAAEFLHKQQTNQNQPYS